MIAWIVAGCVSVIVLVVALVVIVRLLAFASDTEPTEAENIDNDTDEWAWRSKADVR